MFKVNRGGKRIFENWKVFKDKDIVVNYMHYFQPCSDFVKIKSPCLESKSFKIILYFINIYPL